MALIDSAVSFGSMKPAVSRKARKSASVGQHPVFGARHFLLRQAHRVVAGARGNFVGDLLARLQDRLRDRQSVVLRGTPTPTP